MNAVAAHWLADALRNTGRLQESKAEAERSLDLGMLGSGIGIYAHYLLQQDWNGARDFLTENTRAQGIATDFVPVLVDAIDDMIDRGSGMYAFWRMREPQFTHLRNHPRFRDIAARIGFLDYWRKFGWPDQCRPDKDSFVCT